MLVSVWTGVVDGVPVTDGVSLLVVMDGVAVLVFGIELVSVRGSVVVSVADAVGVPLQSLMANLLLYADGCVAGSYRAQKSGVRKSGVDEALYIKHMRPEMVLPQVLIPTLCMGTKGILTTNVVVVLPVQFECCLLMVL